MSRSAIEEAILRSMNDEAFLDRLFVSPDQALRDFDLTEEEIQVIATGDEVRLNEMLGFRGPTANINANQYHHGQHIWPGGGKPDLLPRVVSE